MNLAELTPLLHILAQPNHPGFDAALEKITALTPQQLNAAELPGFLAALQTAIAALQAEKSRAEAELSKLRNQTTALKSYGQNK